MYWKEENADAYCLRCLFTSWFEWTRGSDSQVLSLFLNQVSSPGSCVLSFLPTREQGHPVGFLKSTSTRSEEHTSELQSLMRISYAVFCLKTKITHTQTAI